MAAKTARVIVTLSLTVDVEAYEHGTDPTAPAVRADLKANLASSIEKPGDLVPAWDGIVTALEVK